MLSSLHAAEVAAPSKFQTLAANLFPFILIFVIFYFLLIRPQKKKQQAHQKMLSEIKVSDRVLLNSGIYGNVTKVKDDNKLMVEISDKVEVEVSRAYILSRLEK